VAVDGSHGVGRVGDDATVEAREATDRLEHLVGVVAEAFEVESVREELALIRDDNGQRALISSSLSRISLRRPSESKLQPFSPSFQVMTATGPSKVKQYP
jgi:hypothetical protein